MKYKAKVSAEYVFEVDETKIECEEDIHYAFIDWVDNQNMTGENEFFDNVSYTRTK